MAATESPPPIRVKASWSAVTLARAAATSLVPPAKASISNTPMGPFHRMVRLSSTACTKRPRVSGPMSRPIHVPGMASVGWTSVFASGAKSSAHKVSLGRRNSVPAASALAKIARALSNMSSSTKLVPMLPPWAFTNVYAMPPPTISLSTRSTRFSRMLSLLLTLAPPMMASRGLAGVESTLLSASTSPCMSRPNALSSGKNFAMTAVDAWARCAVPKASLT